MNLFKRALSILLIAFVGLVGEGYADDVLETHYLANAGVLAVSGDTKIVFDPLFDEDFGIYESVPPDIEAALFAGEPPFDGIDAVFVSHYHDDHFSPTRMLRLLKAHPQLQLFAPAQAISSLPLDDGDSALAERLHTVSLEFDGEFRHEFGRLSIHAVRIPHAGWPNRHQDIENIAFHVTMRGDASVLHMGDAHSDDAFYAQQSDYWSARDTVLALPPYWMFLSQEGLAILERRVAAIETIGVHVPREMPDHPSRYPSELQGRKMFTVPGESHSIELQPGEVHPSEK